ncbi:MAG: phage holin family protein [Thermoguttaceae bacterium]
MSEPKERPAGKVRREIGSLAGDMREMASLRWELARLELDAAVASIKRLAIAAIAVGLMVLCALPILAVGLAEGLDGRLGVSRLGWLLIFGFTLLSCGIAGGTLAWRYFRRRFTGFEQSLEELREDLVWLEEQFEKSDSE